MKRRFIFFCLVLLALLLGTNGAQAVTVDYYNIGTFQTPSLHEGGVTVTGSANVNVLNLNGLGIVGGLDDNTIDGAGHESISFLFDTPAKDVTYFVNIAGNTNGDGLTGETLLTAYGTGGYLGDIAVISAGTKNVSALFGNVPISSFAVSLNTADYIRIASVGYNPVPLPGAMWLLGSGLAGLFGLRRRFKK